MALSVTPRTWRITHLCATVAPTEENDGQARRLLPLTQLALGLSGVEAFRGDRQEARRRRDDLAGRFRLGVFGFRRPASPEARAAAPSLPHDGAEALARSFGCEGDS